MKKGLVLLGLAVVALAVGAGAVRPVVPAVFVLGDSTLDVGNNNYLTGEDVPRADKPFYGIDFPGGHKPIGRFSNGYNIADFVGTSHMCMCFMCMHGWIMYSKPHLKGHACVCGCS